MRAAAVRGIVKNFNIISAGLNYHNIECKLFDSVEESLEYNPDFYIQTNIWSQYSDFKDLYYKIKETQKPTLIVESPPFRFFNDSQKWYRLSWNSFLFPEAIYPWHNPTPDRWQTICDNFNLSIKDWKQGDYIVIALQKFSDSSLRDLHTIDSDKPMLNYVDWLDECVKQIQQKTNKEIILRPHPKNNDAQIEKLTKLFPKIHVSKENSYWHNAYCVITFNSLFSLDSLYNGIPVISLSNSSLHKQFTTQTLENLNDSLYAINRKLMFEKLSYCQWSREEILFGIPFKRLLECMPK